GWPAGHGPRSRISKEEDRHRHGDQADRDRTRDRGDSNLEATSEEVRGPSGREACGPKRSRLPVLELDRPESISLLDPEAERLAGLENDREGSRAPGVLDLRRWERVDRQQYVAARISPVHLDDLRALPDRESGRPRV